VAILIATFLAVAWTALFPVAGAVPETARLVAGLMLVLALPGYTLTAAIFPGRRLDLPERLALAVGLSLATAVLGGLALGGTPWGITTVGWVALMTGVTLIAGLVAWVRRSRQPPTGALPKPIDLRATSRAVWLIGLAALVVVGAVAIARTPQSPQGFQGYTLLWLVPEAQLQTSSPGEDSSNYATPPAGEPWGISGGGNLRAQLGVGSRELAPMSYHLRVVAGGRVLYDWPAIELAPSQDWERTIDLPSAASTPGAVEALLYRNDNPGSVYRRTAWRPR
jgi:hypothetical protein